MISPAELTELEATLLPALERHHLRLLGHGLRTLQVIAGQPQGPPPAPEAIRRWCLEQAPIADDPAFVEAFAAQLEATGAQLTAIANEVAGGPREGLSLDLSDLIAWAQRQADLRVSLQSTPPGQPQP